MESKAQDGYSESGASTPEKSESKIILEEEHSGSLKISDPPDLPLTAQKESCLEDGNSEYPTLRKHLVTAKRDGIQESATCISDSSALKASKTPKECGNLYSDGKTHTSGSDMMDATSNLEGATNLATVMIPVRNQHSQVPNGDSNSEEEISKTDTPLAKDNGQMTSRSSDPAIKTRSLSPGIESKNGNKRPAVVCDFFAKGWCIKGNSCRFLHKKDHVDNSIRKNEGEVAVVDCDRKMDLAEGSKDVSERSLTSSAVNYAACSSPFALERTVPSEHGESIRCQPDAVHKLPSIERRYSTPGNALDHQLLASLRDGPGCSSSFKDVDRESLRHIFLTEKIQNHASLVNRGISHLPRNSLFPEYGSIMSSSANHRATFSNASTSKERAYNQSKFMHTSLQTPGMSSSRQMPNNFKSQIPKYNWEPSVPFRPSFFIGSSISSTGSLYDPLRDSIEENNVGDISSSRVCTNDEDASFGNTSLHPMYQKSSLSSRAGLNENISDQDCHRHEKALLSNGVEGVGTSDADQQSGTLAGEENPMAPLNTHETPITNKIDTDCETTNQSDGERLKKDSKVGRNARSKEVEMESKRDIDMPKDLKALKHLRAALIDMVKELLKPTWQEGHLSKDAHNAIVKRTVEKVLSTIQSQQIPYTVESVKQYLSFSQTKIAKLVEAYVGKYGKS